QGLADAPQPVGRRGRAHALAEGDDVDGLAQLVHRSLELAPALEGIGEIDVRLTEEVALAGPEAGAERALEEIDRALLIAAGQGDQAPDPIGHGALPISGRPDGDLVERADRQPVL